MQTEKIFHLKRKTLKGSNHHHCKVFTPYHSNPSLAATPHHTLEVKAGREQCGAAGCPADCRADWCYHGTPCSHAPLHNTLPAAGRSSSNYAGPAPARACLPRITVSGAREIKTNFNPNFLPNFFLEKLDSFCTISSVHQTGRTHTTGGAGVGDQRAAGR